MRRVIVVGVVVLVAVLLWRVQSEGLNFGGSVDAGRDPNTGSPPSGSGAAPELRIEIVETAAESEARYREIIRRYRDDPAAQAWVANCVAQAAVEQGQQEFTASWEYGCWRSWGDQRDSSGR
jgi:hypothetical protein